jgi:hypothetical protein
VIEEGNDTDPPSYSELHPQASTAQDDTVNNDTDPPSYSELHPQGSTAQDDAVPTSQWSQSGLGCHQLQLRVNGQMAAIRL